ncbi:MAG: hypothetical protein JW700_01195 [Candidatus Aenigmarchaeota archaeon]|nr:hypothetical protein [Candidatus Aenigmarchaeota archaeon]
MILRILGLLSIFFGFLVLKYFPGMSDYQQNGMTSFGILIGIVLSIIGVILLIAG